MMVLAANLVPVACVLLFGWSAAILILLYWAENVAIGVFHAAKLFLTGARGGPLKAIGALYFTAFFLVHYGLFCLVHGTLALLFLAYERGDTGRTDSIEQGIADLSLVISTERGFVVGLVVIVAAQAVGLVQWIVAGGWRTNETTSLMAEPYGRIIALHVTLLGAGFLLASVHSPVVGVFLLALLKTLFEGAVAGKKAKAIATGSGS